MEDRKNILEQVIELFSDAWNQLVQLWNEWFGKKTEEPPRTEEAPQMGDVGTSSDTSTPDVPQEQPQPVEQLGQALVGAAEAVQNIRKKIPKAQAIEGLMCANCIRMVPKEMRAVNAARQAVEMLGKETQLVALLNEGKSFPEAVKLLHPENGEKLLAAIKESPMDLTPNLKKAFPTHAEGIATSLKSTNRLVKIGSKVGKGALWGAAIVAGGVESKQALEYIKEEDFLKASFAIGNTALSAAMYFPVVGPVFWGAQIGVNALEHYYVDKPRESTIAVHKDADQKLKTLLTKRLQEHQLWEAERFVLNTADLAIDWDAQKEAAWYKEKVGVDINDPNHPKQSIPLPDDIRLKLYQEMNLISLGETQVTNEAEMMLATYVYTGVLKSYPMASFGDYVEMASHHGNPNIAQEVIDIGNAEGNPALYIAQWCDSMMGNKYCFTELYNQKLGGTQSPLAIRAEALRRREIDAAIQLRLIPKVIGEDTFLKTDDRLRLYKKIGLVPPGATEISTEAEEQFKRLDALPIPPDMPVNQEYTLASFQTYQERRRAYAKAIREYEKNNPNAFSNSVFAIGFSSFVNAGAIDTLSDQTIVDSNAKADKVNEIFQTLRSNGGRVQEVSDLYKLVLGKEPEDKLAHVEEALAKETLVNATKLTLTPDGKMILYPPINPDKLRQVQTEDDRLASEDIVPIYVNKMENYQMEVAKTINAQRTQVTTEVDTSGVMSGPATTRTWIKDPVKPDDEIVKSAARSRRFNDIKNQVFKYFPQMSDVQLYHRVEGAHFFEGMSPEEEEAEMARVSEGVLTATRLDINKKTGQIFLVPPLGEYGVEKTQEMVNENVPQEKAGAGDAKTAAPVPTDEATAAVTLAETGEAKAEEPAKSAEIKGETLPPTDKTEPKAPAQKTPSATDKALKASEKGPGDDVKASDPLQGASRAGTFEKGIPGATVEGQQPAEK